MKAPLILAVVGASGSGKTTIAKGIVAELDKMGLSHSLISQDNFYLPVGEPSSNYDHPDALDLDMLADTLLDIRKGKSVTIPDYDFVTHRRTATRIDIPVSDVVVLEGLFLFSHARLRELIDVGIYLDIDQAVCFERRFNRDQSERGREATDIIRQYNEQVRPGFDEHIQPYSSAATHVIGINFQLTSDWVRSLLP